MIKAVSEGDTEVTGQLFSSYSPLQQHISLMDLTSQDTLSHMCSRFLIPQYVAEAGEQCCWLQEREGTMD